MNVPVDQLAGKTFGQYRPGQLLGQGSLSVVYTAQQLATGRRVMLSLFTLPQECVGKPRERFIERFMQVASAVGRLRHPHLVPLYDFGEQFGYPYLVTPLSESGSLATLLQKHGPYAPERVLAFLRQLADVLDYAHANRVVHGSLKPSAVLVDDQQRIQVAGFGLTQMLVMSGIGHIQHTHPHLFNIAGTLVVNPLYVAPEVVEGSPVDARSDIYSLGVLLFEMLSGRPPFVGTDPLKVAMQHVNGAIPSLLSMNPELSPALDLVLQHALERDPVRRLQTAGALVGPFERVLNVIKAMTNPTIPAIKRQGAPDTTDKHWIPMPGTTGKMPAIRLNALGQSGKIPVAGAPLETGKWPRQEPQFSRKTDSFKAVKLPQTSGKVEVPPQVPQATKKQTGALFEGDASVLSSKNRRAARSGTRRTLLIATGSVVAAGVVGVVGVNVLAKMREQKSSGITNTGKPPQKVSPTDIANSSVIKQENVPLNSAIPFVNSKNGVECILIHLPDGKFVAYQRACTHEAVKVNYNPDTHMLVCPKHGSIFDPTQGAKVLDGPAPAPLPGVTINVNADGTIAPG